MREKGGVGPYGRAEREPFGHTRRLEPQPRGAVTRRAVAQRRSRASGLTRPLAEAIRGFDSGFGLGFVVGPLARSAAVWCKVFCFQFFTYKEGFCFAFCGGRQPSASGGFSLFFSELSTAVVAPTTCSSTTCSSTTCMGVHFARI